MDNELRKMIIVKTESTEEQSNVAEKIHRQLQGNDDYVESRICLNMSEDRQDGTVNEVHVYIFKDSKTNPEIIV